MIGINTYVKVIDTCGAHHAKIFRVLGKKYESAKVADFVVVAIKSATPNKKVKKHEVKKGILVQTKKWIYRKHLGINLSFDVNSVVILGRNNNPVGTRIKGVVTRELRKHNLTKLMIMAPAVI